MRFPFLLVIALLLIGCNPHSESRHLDDLDALVIADKYDSAYHEVLKLNPNKIYNDKDLAHYQLLLAQTSYLTYNSLPTDSVIDSAIRYYERSNEQAKLADAYYYKASCLHERNEDIQAILYYKKAEEVAQNVDNLRLRFKIAESLARINSNNGNYNIQLNYAKKALGCALESGNKNWIAFSYLNLSRAYQNVGNVDSLSKYTKELIPRLGDVSPKDLSHFLSAIGFMFFKNGDFVQAKKYYEEALSHKELPRTLVNLAEVYTEEGNEEEAYKIWQRAFLLEDDGTRDIIMFNMLQYDLEHQKNLEDACERMYRIYTIKDSMANNLKDRTIQEIQQKYDEETQRLLYKSKSMKWMIATLLLIVLVLLMLGYVMYKRSRAKILMGKHQLFISQMNNEITQLTDKCNRAEHDIRNYKAKIVDYTKQIGKLESSGKDARKEKEELNKQIEESVRINEELETSYEEAKQKIESLRQKIADIVEKESPVLNRGKILYDDIFEDKASVSWNKDDYKCFVEYYKALHFKEYESIEKKYKHLTLHNVFFLILIKMGKDNKIISQIMGISQESIRTIRHRIQKKKKQ